MKVTFLKSHKMGSNSFKKDQKAVIITSLAEELIKKGVCEENNSVTLRDEIIEETGKKVAQEIIDNLPDHATDIVKVIPSIVNKQALEHLVTDDRSTVSEAAQERLKEL